MNHLDLFSGIGGFALAVQWLGHKTVGFVEKDPWCREVLSKNFPEVPQLDDIKTYQPGQFGSIDIVTGGFPCQPFSLAGKRRGSDDDRHLWPEMAAVIAAERPRFVLGENVAGLINMGLDAVLVDLEGLGYSTRAVVIPACAVNALHRRDRVWIMAYRNGDDEGQHVSSQGSEDAPIVGERCCTTSDTDPNGERQPQPEGNEQGQRRWLGDVCESMANTEARGVRRRRPSGKPGQPPQRGEGIPHAQGPGADAEELTRQPCGAESCGCRGVWRREVARAVDPGADGLSPGLVRSAWRTGEWELGLSRRVLVEKQRVKKLKAAGNAIVPQVAFEILQVMLAIED